MADGGIFKLEPLRSMDDFLLRPTRFKVPNFNDQDKWTRQMAGNLVYYQTNYFLMAIVVFVIVGIIHPVLMMIQVISVTVKVTGYIFLLNNQRLVDAIKSYLSFIYFIISFISSLLLWLGLGLPILAILLHSSVRLRQTKSKVPRKQRKETITTKTPLAKLLFILLDVELEGGFED